MKKNHDDPLAEHFGIKIEGVMYYNGKPYNLENLQVNIMEKNYDDSLAGHFRIKKTLNFFYANTIVLRQRLILRIVYKVMIFT